MRRRDSSDSFRSDTRGVSALVGFILLFGILIIALASYQAVIVPQQNAQTEFDHNQQVEDEMVDFRNALLEARLDNRERATSVKLGTRYQSRIIAVNPPPATGTLQSTGQGDISVDGSNIDQFDLIGNQYFEYTPSYSEYRDAGTIRYENTLVYHEFESNTVPISEQKLVVDENRPDVEATIRLVPNEPNIDEQGVNRVTYEPVPQQARFVTVENPTITIPTELDVDNPNRVDWVDILDGEVDADDISEDDGDLVLDLDGTYLIKYSFVGDPDGLPEDERDDVGDAETEVNPAESGDVVLENVGGGGGTFTLEFNNTGNTTRTADRVRVPFYSRPGGSAATVNISQGSNGVDAQVGGPFVSPPSDFVFEPDENAEITYEFPGGGGGPNPWFVTTYQFENNERSTYFATP